MDEEQFSKYFQLWQDFKEKVTNETRFFLKHDAIDCIKELVQKNTIKIKKDSVFYRARIYI